MISDRPCRCGHDHRKHRRSHRAGESGIEKCDSWVVQPSWTDRRPGEVCRCRRFDDAVLPDSEGERLEFGVHRMATRDSEAEAWPIGEKRIVARLRKAAGLR